MPDSFATLWRCPSRPNPVTSVAASAPTPSIASAAGPLSVAMMAVACSTRAAGARSRFSAVEMMPIDSGFVSTRERAGDAPEDRTSRSGSTMPVTAIPYFGSWSSTVWPPTTEAPASVALSAPPSSTRASRLKSRS